MAFRMSVKDGGMVANIRHAKQTIPNEKVIPAVKEEMEIELKEMKRRTPVDTTENAPHPGQLRDSLRLEGPRLEGGLISAEITTDVDYAAYVHENPDAHHPIGEWKFIEGPLRESRPYMAQRIAENARKR